MLDLIIKNGRIINPDGETTADIAVLDGKIVDIGDADHFISARKVIDASGLMVLPGMIDSHAHICSDTSKESHSLDDYYNGSIAAAYGGTTSFIDFALPFPEETPCEAMERKLKEAGGSSVVHYSFHAGITRGDKQSLRDVCRLRAEGFPSVKVFTIYRGNLMLDKASLLAVMEDAAREDGLVMIHAESPDLIEANIDQALAEGRTSPRDHADCRPPVSELEAISSVLAMQHETGARVLFAHMSAGQAGEFLRHEDRSRIFTEVCPHYLFLTDEVYDREDGCKFVCSPPIRSAEDQAKLWKLLEDGYVDIVNSDHTDYSSEQKFASKDYFPRIPNGLPTLETRGMALWTAGVAAGRITPSRFVELTSTNAARLMGLYPRKGVIRVGADADLVVWDPNHRAVLQASDLHMQTDYSPYDGCEFIGRVRDTIVSGHAVIENGRYVPSDFRGELLTRDTKSSIL